MTRGGGSGPHAWQGWALGSQEGCPWGTVPPSCSIPRPPPASGLSWSPETPCTQAARRTRLSPTRGHPRARTHIPTPQCMLIESPPNLSLGLRVEGRKGPSPSRPPGNHGNGGEAGSRRKAARARVPAGAHPRLVQAAAAAPAPTWVKRVCPFRVPAPPFQLPSSPLPSPLGFFPAQPSSWGSPHLPHSLSRAFAASMPAGRRPLHSLTRGSLGGKEVHEASQGL